MITDDASVRRERKIRADTRRRTEKIDPKTTLAQIRLRYCRYVDALRREFAAVELGHYVPHDSRRRRRVDGRDCGKLTGGTSNESKSAASALKNMKRNTRSIDYVGFRVVGIRAAAPANAD